MTIKSGFNKIKCVNNFEEYTLEIFKYQYEHNSVYNTWCNLNNISTINDIKEIPFLPINFFKTHNITCLENIIPEDYFLSSGTTNTVRSKHNVYSKQEYLENTVDCFEQFYDKADSYCYICLLPNYLKQQHSSLVCMMQHFVHKSVYKQSGFFKDNLNDVINILEKNEQDGVKTILFGVTYALLDLIALKKFHLRNTVIFETGGMKGRRKELPKNELHNILKEGFGVENISSEYGMCELFSQAYAVKNGRFKTPNRMRVFIKPINDPKGENLIGHSGIINIIDLANINTCCFIQTEDIGIQYSDSTFEIIGRKDNSAIRGCNLMYL